MGTHLRLLSESYPLNNTNMTGFEWFSKNLMGFTNKNRTNLIEVISINLHT